MTTKLGVNMDATELFCNRDDFIKELENININNNDPNLLISRSKNKRGVNAQISLSEIIRSDEFPMILSYSRFIEWIPYCLFPLTKFLQMKMGQVTGINYIDSTSLSVCKNIRIP